MKAALKRADRGLIELGAYALGRIGSGQALDVLVETLNYPFGSVSLRAAEALGEIGNEQAVEPLKRVLNTDKNKFVRWECVRALGRIGSEQAVDALIQTLNDEDQVRAQAASALAQIGSERAIDPLIQRLKDEVSYVRGRAAQALGEIGTLDTLKKLIQSPEVDIFSPVIFHLARKLAVRFSKEKAPFIPVYPELIGEYKAIPKP